MAAAWRCDRCGRKQPIETLSDAIQGSFLIRYFGSEIEIPIHNCSPEQDRRTRSYLTLWERWAYPFAAVVVLGVACAIVMAAREVLWPAGAAMMALGALVLLVPAVRNTVKMDPSTKHALYRWLGDVMMPNRTPGDLLVCWRTCILTARVMGAVTMAGGLLILVSVLK
jgi:hypothetical protein